MSIDNSHKISDVKVMLKVGADGSGISSIEKTGTSGLVDTYTITLSTGAKYTFTVTNGKSIDNIAKTGTTGLVDTYTITYNDSTTSTFTITNGNGISDISKTSTAGLVDTYTITFTNGDTSTFTVTNGVGGGMSAKIIITSDTGSTVTLTDPSGASIPVVQVAGTTDQWEGETTVYGTHTVVSVLNSDTITKTVDVDACKIFEVDASHSSVPEGATVTPTDDIQIWLHCANIWDKSYTTLNEVLADSTTLASLMSDNNAVDYLVRSTTWASEITGNALAMHDIGINNYCADTLLADSTWLTAICGDASDYLSLGNINNVLNVKVPRMTSDNTPYGEATASTYVGGAPMYVFDSLTSDGITFAENASDPWVCYEFTEPVAVKCVHITESIQRYSLTGKIQAYINGAWVDKATINKNTNNLILPINNNEASTKWRYVANTFTTGMNLGLTVYILQFHGREDVPATITKKTFATATDAEINEMCKWSERGVIDLETDCGWAVGQEHTFTLGAIATTGTFNGITWTVGEAQSSQSVTVVLTRKGGAELVSPVLSTDGTSRNTPTFEWDFKDCLGTAGYMNSTNTNTGSWGASARRSWCNSGLLQQMLSVLPKLCNLFKVITAKTYNGSENETTNDYFALRAEKEIFGTATRSNTTEAGALTQATYYETSANRAKKVDGSENGWWERSPLADAQQYFCSVAGNGSADYNPASTPYGISTFGVIG